MNTESLQAYLEEITTDQSHTIDISFARKNHGIINSPSISRDLKQQIVDMLAEDVREQISKNKIVDYQAVGVLDGEIEQIKVSDVIPDKEEQLERVFVINISDEKKFDWGNVDYYVIEIEAQGKVLKLYRQFQKMKRLRKGIMLQTFSDELVRMDSDFIAIDETVDILEWEKELLIFNHIALERIFGYRDLFEKKTKEAIGIIKNKDIFENIEEFQEACMRDGRIQKRFTNIMQNERLPLFFKNLNKVPKLIKDLNLHLEFSDSGKLLYTDRKQLYEITNLMNDAYFRSLLADRIGVAKLEGVLEE